MKTFHHIVSELAQTYPESEARALARWLLEDRFGLSQTDILLDKDNELSADDRAILQEITLRLLRCEPIQYILGHTDFCNHRFFTGPEALIPRPETQQLVHLVVDGVSHTVPAGFSGSILDIGTGTGCIALSLSLALPQAHVTGWDVSEAALLLARRNAALYPQTKVTFEQRDILQPPVDDRQWDVIVSNPPYVRKSEAREMDSNVLRYEPHLALFVPDEDPLRFYRAIGRYAQGHLVPGGMLYFEINQAYGAETSDLIEEFGFRNVTVLKDEYSHDRFVVTCKPSLS